MPSLGVPGAAVPGGAVPGGAAAVLAPGVTLPAAPQVTVTAWPPSVTGTPGVALPAAQAAVKAWAPGFVTANVQVVNQWAATFAQPGSFGPTPPALQSAVIALTPATSVGSGSGTPASGNWLFLLAGWNQAGLPGVAAGGADDIHSFWRPGDVTTSAWASSPKTGKTRCMIWYTANLARAAGDVYAAPSGAVAGMACTVVEIAGLGPWDTVTGIHAAYAAAATSLSLPLAAPSQAAFTIACVCGDSSAVSQAFAPAGWAALSTVTASNGADHSCDAVLTSACLPSTAGSVSVSGTTSSASDLSGVILQVQVSAASPVPASQNPSWPYVKFEAAFGGGFQTPPDELTWTDLTSRLWSWNETTGIQYQLGDIQATELNLELDNFDGALSSDNPASPYAGQILTGVPLRLRAAIGTLGGQQVNRWYVIQRNAEQWPQQIDPAYRRKAPATATDIWSVLSATGPTPYRGEVENDSPYAWWPCDDGLLTGGTLPRSLRNAAAGNSSVLNIIPSPNGVTQSNNYGTDGYNFSVFVPPTTGISTSAGVAVYAQPAQQGWMPGDPQSSPSSNPTGNPVTASPGAAAWQMSGAAGNTGANGWFLSVNDASFPPLSAGVTIEIWFNYGFFGSAGSGNQGGVHVIAGQPYANQTIWDMTTGSAPVALLQISRSTGHLNLITYSGSTPTTHAVYTGSDLRGQSWHMATVRLTQSTWAVDVDGGATASVSGSAAISASAWSWLVVNGDMGTSGGGTTPAIANGGNAAFSHIAVYGSVLPAWRVRAHYWAGVTAFGTLPAPTATSFTIVQADGSTFTPDGAAGGGSYGFVSFAASAFAFAAVITANAGSYTSGPSAWSVQAGQGGQSGGDAVFVTWSGVAPEFSVYTSAQVDGETLAAVTSCTSDTFTAKYGATATGVGPGQVSGGTGASPPASGSALGDTVAQRIERILGYGNVTYPGRCIDPAPLQVQAATDVGGTQTGPSVTNITQSDGGLLSVDNLGSVCYFQRSHTAAQYSSPAWTITPAAPPTAGAPLTAIPYGREDFNWLSDPQRVWNAILITPFSPDGVALAGITPSQSSQVAASQLQYGPQPKQLTSYLQSQSEMQNQADFLFSNYGQARIRVDGVRIDAAPYPAAFQLVFGVNIGDVLNVTNWQIGGGGITGTFRVSNIKRVISFGGDDPEDMPKAEVILTCDYEPPSQWA